MMAVESSRNKEIRVYIMYFRHKFKIKVSNYYEGQLKKMAVVITLLEREIK